MNRVLLLMAFVSTLSFCAIRGHADELSDARTAQEQAKKRYYDAVRVMANPTETDRERLKKEILDPANEREARAAQKWTQSQLSAAGVKARTQATSHTDKSTVGDEDQTDVLTIRNPSTQVIDHRVPAAPEPSSPEEALEGDQIPRVLEFPGKKPGPVPPAPDVIEFPGKPESR